MNSMNFWGFVIRSRQPNSYQQVYNQLLFTKIAILSHFSVSILWIASIQLYYIFTQQDGWFDNITNYCFSHGCIWPMILIFIYHFFVYYLLFFAIGIFINQFANLGLSLEKNLIEDQMINRSVSIEEQKVN